MIGTGPPLRVIRLRDEEYHSRACQYGDAPHLPVCGGRAELLGFRYNGATCLADSLGVWCV
jgi:hypothetical protein